MSRRDTIIVAVLINAGLIIVLFASALKSQSSGDELVVAPPSISHQMPSTSLAHVHTTDIGDDVDLVLNQYQLPQVAVATPPPAEAAVAAVPTPSFTEELQFVSPPEVFPTAASAAAVSQPVKTEDVIEHRVKKGDVLERIARRHHCSVDQIMKLNHLTSTNLRIGQLLKIPASGSNVSPVKEVIESTPQYYIVKNGDNPWTIAVKNHLKVDELLKLNDLNEEKARRLKPGDQLRIR